MREKKTLTKKTLDKLYKKVMASIPDGEMIGMLGGVPVIADPTLPDGYLFCKDAEGYVKMFRLPKPKKVVAKDKK